MKQTLLVLFIMVSIFAFTHDAYAQTSERKWAITGYGGLANYDGDYGSNLFEFSPFYGFGGAGLSYYLSPSFDAELRIQNGHLGFIPDATLVPGNNFLVEQTFFNGSVHYKILKDKKFKPYLAAGLGFSSYDVIEDEESRGIDETSFVLPLGIGFDWNFTDVVALAYQTTYGLNFSDKFDVSTADDSNDNFFHHSLGLKFNLGKMDDADGDGIADKNDACPDVAGLKEFKGCPDTDGDGITDADDRCPKEAGTVALGGCPDMDGDGVVDIDDRCPKLAGTAEMKGCPDGDGDGVADIDDKCPKIAGTMKMKGCPDADGDGVADADDKCPKVKGSAATMGCPDTDGDGVADKDDSCPKVKGLAKFKGCPDTDGDGIMDSEDKCPNEKGLAVNGGCPVKDTDGDGVEDSKDRCPTIKGLASNGGCPEIKQADKDVMIEALEGVYFNTNKATIKNESYAVLDKVVKIMSERPSYKINIEGHTDSDGADDFNHTLSHKRANAVKTYLVSKGVSSSRLNAKGYGETRPKATNATAAGKKLNRRVEFNLYN